MAYQGKQAEITEIDGNGLYSQLIDKLRVHTENTHCVFRQGALEYKVL